MTGRRPSRGLQFQSLYPLPEVAEGIGAASDPGVASTAAEIADRIRAVRENFMVNWFDLSERRMDVGVCGRTKTKKNVHCICIKKKIKRRRCRGKVATIFKSDCHIHI